VQDAFLRTIKGFENIKIIRPAYAVEYDYINPIQLNSSLEAKVLSGLFIAGQTNGTSGMRKLRSGLIAGINACNYVENKEPLVLGRDEAYIGVLIDDLVTKGTKEPYRLFTSRAEYRLKLRQDNSLERLSGYAVKYGLLNDEETNKYNEKIQKVGELKDLFATIKLSDEDIRELKIKSLRREQTGSISKES